MENFPGFPDGVDGPVLMENMRAQAQKFGAEMIDDDIVSVDLTGDIKLLTDSSGTVHRAKTVIIATGSGYRKLGLRGAEELPGRGVSWCATCDGFFFRDRDILVVGGGDTAMEEATFPTRFARSVTVVHRRSTLRASKVMQDRAFAQDKISFAFDSEIAEIKETNGMLGGVVLRDVFTGATRDLDVTGLFAIGHDPRTELFTSQLDLDDEGYIKVASPRRAPACPACSPPATSSTTPTAKPSPPPEPALLRPWTPSATSHPAALHRPNRRPPQSLLDQHNDGAARSPSS